MLQVSRVTNLARHRPIPDLISLTTTVTLCTFSSTEHHPAELCPNLLKTTPVGRFQAGVCKEPPRRASDFSEVSSENCLEHSVSRKARNHHYKPTTNDFGFNPISYPAYISGPTTALYLKSSRLDDGSMLLSDTDLRIINTVITLLHGYES